MKRIIAILLVMILFMPNTTLGDTFSGTGDSTTTTFESSPYTKISWNYVAENEYDAFSVFIYEEGSSTYVDNFDGMDGVTYLYETGTYYFDVISANIENWEITTTSTEGEYLQSGDVITGSQDKVTQLFDSPGKTTFDWKYTAENEYDEFSVFIYELGSNIYSDTFSGSEGTSTLYGLGTYYLSILAANIENYQITVTFEAEKSSSSDTGNINPSSSNLDTLNQQKDNDSQTNDTFYPSIFFILTSIFVGTKLRHYKKQHDFE